MSYPPKAAFSSNGIPFIHCPLCEGRHQKIVIEDQGQALVKCSECGAAYLSPQPSRTDLKTHFEEFRPLNVEVLERTFEKNRARPLARVARYVQNRRSGGVILDVACGTGLFLSRFFSDRRWQPLGIEISPATAERASEKGIEVHLTDIHAAGFAQSSVDVITVLDAFYYFPEPLVDLWEYHRILRSGGLLVIELPLAASRIWRKTSFFGGLWAGGRKSFFRSSDHSYFYSPKSLNLLLEKAGFQVFDVLQLPANKQANPLRDAMFYAYFMLSSVLRWLSASRIFLGPRFLVAARKRSALNQPRLRH